MFTHGRTKALKENVTRAGALTAQLAADERFRRQLLRAAEHGFAARRRLKLQLGARAAATRLATDELLRDEIRRMTQEARGAWTRAERKRGHGVRNSLLLLVGAGGAAAAASPGVRRWIADRSGAAAARTITATVEVDVPVSTAYNQWTQFEEFPLFMDGVEDVQQLDDTRLHWTVTVAGKRAEWDAKILEQHPDSQISWISEDGRKTRGTVTFEPLGENRSLVRLSMAYRAEGLRELAGSAAGLDFRRVNGDLKRFKQLVEGRDSETGAWRGEVSEGAAH